MDHEAEIIGLREEVAGLKADVANLCGWQKTQNGALLRADERLLRVDSKVDGIYKVLLGTATTAALSFLGTIVTLLVVLSTRR